MRPDLAPDRVESGPPRAASPRCALILTEDLGGGTGNHLCGMLERWDTDSWRPVIVTQIEPLVRTLPSGVSITVVRRTGWYDRFPFTQVRRLFALARLVKRLRPDVVHTYFFWSIIYGRLLKLIGRTRVLIENREDLGFSWGPVQYAMLRWTRAVPDRIICVAEAVRRFVIEHEGVEEARTTVIQNGVAAPPSIAGLRVVARAGLGIADDQPVIGMVANVHRSVKGAQYFIDAVPMILAQVPSARFLFVGLGTDSEDVTGELSTRGVLQQVTCAGYQTDVEPYYAAMDVSVLTSTTEGLSITLLESMARGLPIVASRVGGNPDLIVDGETGMLVPPMDVPAFVEAVVRLLRDEALRRRMGAAAATRAREKFSIDVVARRYLEVYGEVASRARIHHQPMQSRRERRVSATPGQGSAPVP